MTPPKKRPKQDGNARQRIGDATNARLNTETIEALLDDALEQAIGVKAICGECGNELTVKMRDVKKTVDTLTALLEQAEGRPELRQTEQAVVVIERPPL